MLNPLRVRTLSKIQYSGGKVVYKMCRDIRVHDNDALLFAQELAKKYEAELVVEYTIWNYEWEGATRRFYDWVLPSLEEIEKELRKYNIPLVITFVNSLSDVQEKEKYGAVVIDQLPLHFMNTWKHNFIKACPEVPLYEVDAHNCIPVWTLSEKQEFAARTIRSKVHAKIEPFLEEYAKLSQHTKNEKSIEVHPLIDWEKVHDKIVCREDVSGTGNFVPGSIAAHNILSTFLDTKLHLYDTSRNDINIDGQSNLSPYIAHGNISRRRIILEVLKKNNVSITDAFDAKANGSNGKMGSLAAFIEECVIRAELSENFCFYNPHYDSYKGFPSWAQDTLSKARTDTRVYVYTQKQLEDAFTHDALWNAAQTQMVQCGKMHGYMRMYWAKKILEWTSTPEEAMKIAVYLNDVYELDGRDPNGYVGCAWSIGGVHDRPWFGRPVFGTIRYMAQSG